MILLTLDNCPPCVMVKEFLSKKKKVIRKKWQRQKRHSEKERKDIEKILNKKVKLELFVKVRKDWRNNSKFIKDKYNQSFE